MSRKKINTNCVDTHMRIHNELRNYLIDVQNFYNSEKDNDKTNISMNTLCNIAILVLKDYLESLTEVEQKKYLIGKLAKYEELIEKSGV